MLGTSEQREQSMEEGIMFFEPLKETIIETSKKLSKYTLRNA